MEQTKNEPTKENKAAPDTGKPKKGREPLTEAQRLKRQKMIVLPAMVLVFIGAMWLIFAPSSGKCNLQIFLCLFLEKLNMPQNTPVTKVS